MDNFNKFADIAQKFNKPVSTELDHSSQVAIGLGCFDKDRLAQAPKLEAPEPIAKALPKTGD